MTHDSKTLTRLLEEAIDRVIDDLNYERVGLRSIIRDNLTLRKRVEELERHIAEQAAHAETRIADGRELGAVVWRIALENVVRASRAVLPDTGEQ